MSLYKISNFNQELDIKLDKLDHIFSLLNEHYDKELSRLRTNLKEFYNDKMPEDFIPLSECMGEIYSMYKYDFDKSIGKEIDYFRTTTDEEREKIFKHIDAFKQKTNDFFDEFYPPEV